MVIDLLPNHGTPMNKIITAALFTLFFCPSAGAQQIISSSVPFEGLSGITNCAGSCDAAPAWGSTVPPFVGNGFMGFHEFLTFGGEAWSAPLNQVLVPGSSYTYRVMATIAPITGGTWPPSGGGNHDGVIFVYVGNGSCTQGQLIGTIQLFTPADVNTWRRFCFTFTANGNYNYLFFRAKTEPQDYIDCAYMGIDDVNDGMLVTHTNVSCGGGNNGTATATLTGGTLPYTYSWSPTGQTTSTATGLSAGTYTVTAIDANGCAGGTQTVAITGAGGIAVTSAATNVNCFGNHNGMAAITPSGGTPPYTYSWSPTGGVGSSATGLSAGTYSVIITDANGCSGTQTVTITQPPALTATASATSVICSSTNASATVTATGGTPGYTYHWNPSGQITPTASNLASGNYTVTVTDAKGCTSSNTITVTSSGSITATAGPNSTICSGQSVTLTASGGGNYLWNNGNTNSMLYVTPTVTSTYSVIVSAGSCSDTAITTVLVNASPSVALGNDQTLCNGQSLTLNAGNPGASYLWSTGATTQTVNVSGTGSYWVIVAYTNCLAKDTVATFIAPEVHLFDSSLCTTSPLVLDPGAGASGYLWSTGSTSQTISVSAGGTYWVVAIFGNCMSGDSAVITGDGTGGTLFVPNAFTPNDDQLNELFLAKGTGIASFDMNIFDRWGNLVFATDNIDEGWDGKIQGGHYILKKDGKEISQEDVYIWKIDYSLQCAPQNRRKKTGHVSIVK